MDYYDFNLDYYKYLYKDHIEYSNKLLIDIIPILRKNNVQYVLDACCGTGSDVEFFLKHNFIVYASDLNPSMVDYTKERVVMYNLPDSHFFQANALELDKKCVNEFDLVCFRGNTLGHMNSKDQHKTIEALLHVTKKNGLLLIDFRNGEKYSGKKSIYEQRGWGYDKIKKRLFFSFYILKKGAKMLSQYNVMLSIYVLELRKLRIKKTTNRILANYVSKDSIMELLSRKKLKPEFIQNRLSGLPFVETIIIKNSVQ